MRGLCDTSETGCPSNGWIPISGVAPFTSGNSPSNYDLYQPRTPAYWSIVDNMVATAAKYNVVVFMNTLETGSWLTTLENNGATKAFNYGVFLGNRYKNSPNIVWEEGNDFQTWDTSSSDNNLFYQVD